MVLDWDEQCVLRQRFDPVAWPVGESVAVGACWR